MSADPRTTAELADALEARAATEDATAKSIVIEGPEWAQISLKEARDHADAEAALLRAASARLRAMDAALRRAAESMDDINRRVQFEETSTHEQAFIDDSDADHIFHATSLGARAARTARGES